jgi:hypothetical protein
MFEELIDVKKTINPESYNPIKVARPSIEPTMEYEDTPEFRQSLNMKVMVQFSNKFKRNLKISTILLNDLIISLTTFGHFAPVCLILASRFSLDVM